MTIPHSKAWHELIATYGQERIEGVSSCKLGIAVNSAGKTYNEIH